MLQNEMSTQEGLMTEDFDGLDRRLLYFNHHSEFHLNVVFDKTRFSF